MQIFKTYQEIKGYIDYLEFKGNPIAQELLDEENWPPNRVC